jgi:hypothetical protein
MGRNDVRAWGPYDTALWHTCAVLNALQRDTVAALPVVGVPFAMQLGGQQERIFGSGEMTLLAWDSPGDGSYYQSGGFFLATGRGGLALTAGAAGVRAIRNAARKREAAALAEPRWMPIDSGLVHVGSHGFYLQSANGLFAWDWNSIDSAQVVEMSKLWIQGQSSSGPISWTLQSHWAELAFVLWATVRNPRHPQLIDGSWLPQHWLHWAAGQGYPPPQIGPATG